ncbi:MAG: hypothetical protein E7607_04350 [Ruminococcaceae bacterium]|nr:hypothetical protein [Oscillospiraceae bacterium]
MAEFNEKVLKITDYKVLGRLPDPFLREDGSRAETAEEFDEHKSTLYKSVVELQYGHQPPEPEFLEIEYLSKSRRSRTYRIVTGRRDYPISFYVRIFLPEGKENEKCPVIVDGDLCFDYAFDTEYLDAMLKSGIGFALFNRTELVPDSKEAGKKGPLYNCYPEYDFGALGAWAWGYSRCIDAIIKLDIFDNDWIAVTGHSRGGKTAALAGVLDKRIRVVAPNETNAGSCSCYRIHMKAINEDGEEKKSETLADLIRRFDYWMGPKMSEYAECEEKLPFDAHFLKAMIAPRTLIVAEAASDIWTNPIGSWMTTQAAKEVYKLYGKEENLFWYYRHGYHYHTVEDIKMVVSVIKHQRDGEPLCNGFFSTPFEEPELIYEWRCPEK